MKTTLNQIIDILDCDGLDEALIALDQAQGHDREIRLYASWCARQVESLMTDKRSISALDVAERYANGLATADELSLASVAADAAATDVSADVARAMQWAVEWNAAQDAGLAAALAATSCVAATLAARNAACYAVGAAAGAAGTESADQWDAAEAAREAQGMRLREVCAAID